MFFIWNINGLFSSLQFCALCRLTILSLEVENVITVDKLTIYWQKQLDRTGIHKVLKVNEICASIFWMWYVWDVLGIGTCHCCVKEHYTYITQLLYQCGHQKWSSAISKRMCVCSTVFYWKLGVLVICSQQRNSWYQPLLHLAFVWPSSSA